MKVTRADWAGSVPWSGITGKPANLGSSSSSTDIAALMARVARLEAAVVSLSQVVSELQSGRPGPFHVWLDIGTLEPLQSGFETVALADARATSLPVVFCPSAVPPGIVVTASPSYDGAVLLVVVNSTDAAVSLSPILVQISLLNG